MGLLTNISLFSGAGGLDLGAKLVGGFRTIAYCEWSRYPQAVLMSRIRGGELDDAPIWDDVSTFDGKPWAGRVDVISGGFPCQDLSVAGSRAGIIEGARSGLWKEYARIIREVGPRFILVENVSGLLLDGALGVVLGDLADLGFDAQWAMFPACAVGAPHQRLRVFIIANSKKVPINFMGIKESKEVNGAPFHKQWGEAFELGGCDLLRGIPEINVPGPVVYKSSVHGVDDGLAHRLDRIGCCGNGVVPQQAEIVWQKIKELAEVAGVA